VRPPSTGAAYRRTGAAGIGDFALRFARPVVQAGMGGGLAGRELAAAVSAAGGLGTIGLMAPDEMEADLAAARRLTGNPVAVNVLLPFARAGHWRVAAQADAVVTFWGRPRRRTDGVWLHQCGSVDEVLAAQRAGADGAIVQGVEAGGHVRGSQPALELLAQVRRRVPAAFRLWLAGGIAEAGDVRRALDAGAEAAVAGTRFVATDECRAHPGYKAALIAADDTELTRLFGAGWHAQHRVIPNAATRRWGRAAPVLGAVHAATAPLLARAPLGAQTALAGRRRAALPVLTPIAPLLGDPDRIVDAAPLYAGETVARIHDIRPAADVVRDLTP
jgi:NAD(P)H-dependent flavin oxidoreductase YrpB (nitropropane dioxygenase family)